MSTTTQAYIDHVLRKLCSMSEGKVSHSLLSCLPKDLAELILEYTGIVKRHSKTQILHRRLSTFKITSLEEICDFTSKWIPSSTRTLRFKNNDMQIIFHQRRSFYKMVVKKKRKKNLCEFYLQTISGEYKKISYIQYYSLQ